MNWLAKALSSTVGRKQVIALTGLALCGFLLTHLAGNLSLFAGQEAFDGYAEKLANLGPLLYVMEVALLAVFAVHIGLAISITVDNRRARGSRYAVPGDRGAVTLGSQTMPVTGLIILVFLVLHLIDFRFGERVDGSLYRLVLATFQGSTAYVVWYVVASFAVALHVSHGLRSALQTLGLRHPKYDDAVTWLSLGFAALVAVGYSVLPVYAKFFAPAVTPS